MQFKAALASSAFLVLLTTGAAFAVPVDYVRICDSNGVGYYYIPGTDECYNAKDAMHEGVAVSLAIPTPQIAPGDHFAVGGNVGAYEGAFAAGFGAAAAVNPHFTINGGIGVGSNDHTVGAKAGFNFSW